MNQPEELETTVPTDLTVSSISDDGRKLQKYNADTYLDRKQTLRDVQSLKMELMRKNALIGKLQQDLTDKTSSFDEKLKDALHQKQVIETRFKAQLTFLEEEFNSKFNAVTKELLILQQAKKAVDDEVQNLKSQLDSPIWDEEHFRKLKSKPRDTWSLTEYTMVKIYEHQSQLNRENDFLRSRTMKVDKLLPNLQNSLQVCREDLQREKTENMQLKEKYSKLLSEHNNTTSRIQYGNFAQENFNRVKCERDRLNNEILDMKKNLNTLKVELFEAVQAKDIAKDEVVKLKQSQAVLQKECETMSRQLSEVTQRWGESQDKAIHLQSELDRAKSSYSELMERFMLSRDQQRAEFEDRLRFEKNKTDSEIRSTYENEIRSLTESKTSILRKREITETGFKELKKKYEILFSEYQEKCSKELELVKKLQQELATKEDKLHRTDAALNQLRVTYQEKCKAYDAIAVKLELVVEELDALKKSSREKIIQLETDLGASKARLEIFEKLENEINEVINEAAQIVTLDAEEKVEEMIHQLPIPASARFSFVRSVDLPIPQPSISLTIEDKDDDLNLSKIQAEYLGPRLKEWNLLQRDTKPSLKKEQHGDCLKALQQNFWEMLKQTTLIAFVNLTRRTMELERKLESLQQELDHEKDKNTQLLTELEHSQSLLSMVEQPYSYLIAAVSENKEKLLELQAKVNWQQQQLELASKEKSKLQVERNQLLEDLELVLQNREEMSKIKLQIENLKVLDAALPADISKEQHKNEDNTVPKRLSVSKQKKR